SRAKRIKTTDKTNKRAEITERAETCFCKFCHAKVPREDSVTANMKNMGIVTKVALTFLLINHTAIANRASAASNWLADPNSGHSVENPPDCNNKTDSTTTIPVEKYL